MANSLKSELNRAGASGLPRLYMAAVEALRASGRNPFAARFAFHKAVAADVGLQIELELEFLRGVSRDIESGREIGMDRLMGDSRVHQNSAVMPGRTSAAVSPIVKVSVQNSPSGDESQTRDVIQKIVALDNSGSNAGGDHARNANHDLIVPKSSPSGDESQSLAETLNHRALDVSGSNAGGDHSQTVYQESDVPRNSPSGDGSRLNPAIQLDHASEVLPGLSPRGDAVQSLIVRTPATPISVLRRNAAQYAARLTTLTLLDTFKVRDGRAIGDVKWYELGTLVATNTREAAILTRVKARYAFVPDETKKIRDIIRAKELESIIKDLEGNHDNPKNEEA